MKQHSDWVKGFAFGYKIYATRDRLSDFLAGAFVGLVIGMALVLARWL